MGDVHPEVISDFLQNIDASAHGICVTGKWP